MGSPWAGSSWADPAEGEPAHGETEREIAFDGKDWRVSATPLRDASGKVACDLLIMRDVSTAKAAFARLMALGGTASAVLLALLLVKLLWAWTVPELFPGAVKAGLIAETISWYASFKLAIFIAVLAGVARAGRGR